MISIWLCILSVGLAFTVGILTGVALQGGLNIRDLADDTLKGFRQIELNMSKAAAFQIPDIERRRELLEEIVRTELNETMHRREYARDI